jgi:putative NADH-flavin reductase
MDLLLWCDTVIHQFPIYWWSVPAIHKGWFDRVLAYHWCYGAGAADSLRGKEWMFALTTGGPSRVQLTGGWPAPHTHDIPSHLQPFWVATPAFLKGVRLPLFIAGGPGGVAREHRGAMLEEFANHVRLHVTRSVSPADVPPPKHAAVAQHSATRSLCIVGATGGLGSQLARQALAAGLKVSGVIRSAAKGEEVFTAEERTRLTLHVGSLDDAAFLATAFEGIDAVVEVISNSERPDGVRKILDAAQSAGVTTVGVTGGAVTLFTDAAGKTEASRAGLLQKPGDPDWMPWATKLHAGVLELAKSYVGKGKVRFVFQVAPPFMGHGAQTHRFVPLADVLVEGRSPDKVAYGDTAGVFLEALQDPNPWQGQQIGLVAKP